MKTLAAALALLCVSSRVAAADPDVVGLLDVRGEGVSDVVLAKFSEAIEEGLAGGEEVQVASHDRMREMLASSTWSPACNLGPCLAEVRSQTGAGFVVTAGVTGSGESYRYTITLLETKGGDVVRQMSESCPACTVEDLASAATLATIELLNDVGATAAPVAPDSAEVVGLRRRVHRQRSLVRRGSVLVLGAGLLTAGTALYFVQKGRTDVGYPLLGATAGLAASGVVMLGLSFRF